MAIDDRLLHYTRLDSGPILGLSCLLQSLFSLAHPSPAWLLLWKGRKRKEKTFPSEDEEKRKENLIGN